MKSRGAAVEESDGPRRKGRRLDAALCEHPIQSEEGRVLTPAL